MILFNLRAVLNSPEISCYTIICKEYTDTHASISKNSFHHIINVELRCNQFSQHIA